MLRDQDARRGWLETSRAHGAGAVRHDQKTLGSIDTYRAFCPRWPVRHRACSEPLRSLFRFRSMFLGRASVSLRTLPAPGGAVSVLTASPVPERKFGELLIEEGAITREQLEDALRVQSTLRHYLPLGQVLLNRGRISRSLLTTLLRRHRKSARLGELLVRSGQITTDQLQTALDQQTRTRQPLGHTLMALGFVSEEAMRGALCAQVHVNFFDLDLIKLDPSLARLVNEKYASRRRVVPLFRAGSMLVVGVDDPTDTAVVADLQL